MFIIVKCPNGVTNIATGFVAIYVVNGSYIIWLLAYIFVKSTYAFASTTLFYILIFVT